MSKTFKTSKSKFILVTTILISIVLLTLIIGFINQILTENELSIRITYSFIMIILILLFTYSILNSLKRITVHNSSIDLHFNGFISKIEFSEIISIAPFKKLPPFFMGSQGFWGFNGIVNGDTKTSVNKLDSMIFIKTKRKNYIFSVDDPQNFLFELNNVLKQG